MLSQDKVSFSELGLQLLSAAENMEACLAPHLSQINTSVKQLKQKINLSIPPAILQYVLLDELHEFQQKNPYLTSSGLSAFYLRLCAVNKYCSTAQNDTRHVSLDPVHFNQPTIYT